MALAVNRTGTIFKKCDRSNHRPDTSKACAAGTCQHTCEPSGIEKCAHAWTLRYSVNGKQVEKSFRDKAGRTSVRLLRVTCHTWQSRKSAGSTTPTPRAGKLGKYNLADIRLADNGVKKARTDFVFPAYDQVRIVAHGVVFVNKRLCSTAPLSVPCQR